MKITEHLDRIFKLGFWISLNWNEEFEIYYNANDVMPATAYAIGVLRCSYYKSKVVPYSYEDMIEACCDIFYSWYNKNIEIVREFDDKYDKASMEKLEDHCLGDITKTVARDLNLTDILKLYEKGNF